jgi:hypothetical protein
MIKRREQPEHPVADLSLYLVNAWNRSDAVFYGIAFIGAMTYVGMFVTNA